MTLQNRVTPQGNIVASPTRGLFMGNRGGRIHDPATRTLLKRRWASKRWICCLTSFKGRQRRVMGQSYTELFFLDEITAFAAGHRPCFECRRGDAVNFARLWQQACALAEPPGVDDMDRVLHRERIVSGNAMPPLVETAALPDGAMICDDGDLFAIRNDMLLRWSFEGYKIAGKRALVPRSRLLTPPSIVAILGAGYTPVWHKSAIRS